MSIPKSLAGLNLASLTLMGGIVVASPAFAHNLVMEAYALGNTIEGEAFFSDGTFAKNATIEVTGPDGSKLAVITTDDKGNFSYTPSKPVDQHLHLDMGSGHIANVTVLAAKFAGGAVAAGSAPVAVAAPSATAPLPVSADLQAQIDQFVGAEIEPLRTEISGYKDHNDLMNLLAAIGLLCGAAGMLLFSAGAQKAKTLSVDKNGKPPYGARSAG